MHNLKFINWFDSFCTEDVEDLLTIGEWGKRVLKEKLNMNIGDPKKPASDIEKKMVIAIFGITLETVIQFLKSKQGSNYESYNINFANRVDIGYSTSVENDNIDEEKSGNFMPYMYHVYDSKTNNDRDEDEYNSITLATQWNAANVKTSIEDIKEISTKALEKLKDYSIHLGTNELVIPIFCLIYEIIVSYIKIQRANNNDFEYILNVASIATARAVEGEDGDVIYFDTSIFFKRTIKDDERGSSSKEY